MNPKKSNAVGISHIEFIKVVAFYGTDINIQDSKVYFINYLNKKQSFIKHSIRVELVGDVIIFKREI